MTRCVVIGGNGFLGSHLVDSLTWAGHDVTVFDRFSRGIVAFEASNVRRVAGDFMNLADLERAVEGNEVVFHMLSTTTPATAERDPSFDIRTNIEQTVALLTLCVSAGVKRFFYASSGGAIYGPQTLARYPETAALNPISPYGIGKLTVEKYLGYFRETSGLSSVALRISNPYGGRQSPQKVQGLIPILLRNIELGHPITRLGDGSMTRDYIYVKSVAERIRAMMNRHTTRFEAYNIGSGIGHSVNDVIAAVSRVTGIEPVIRSAPKPATFVDHVVLDTTRFDAEFGKQSDLSLEEGIRRTWTDIQSTK